jgi:hypothetical protein
MEALMSSFVASAPTAAKPHGVQAETGLEEAVRVISGVGWNAKKISHLSTVAVKAYGNAVADFFGGITWLGAWSSTACVPPK